MPTTASITLLGYIQPNDWLYPGDAYYPASPGISFVRVKDAVDAAGEFDKLTVYIEECLGGVIEEGFKIYDYLKSLNKPVTTIAYGMVASMGTVLLSAGDVRLLAPHAQYVIHLPGYDPWNFAESHLNKVDLIAYAESLSEPERLLLEVYASVSGKDQADIATILADGKDHYYTANEALAYGFTTGIYDSVAAAAARHKQKGGKLVFARLADGKAIIPIAPAPTTSTAQTDSPNTIQDKMNAIVQKGIDALNALLKGAQPTSQLVKTADDKELDITTAGDSYAIGDSLKYSDGTDVPDGKIVLADGTTITVAAGVITAIEAPADDNADSNANDSADASASVNGAETVTISKAEFDRLTEEATTAQATATAHAALQTDFNSFKTRTSAVLAAMESKDPMATIEPATTPIDRRTPAPQAGPAELKKQLDATKKK